MNRIAEADLLDWLGRIKLIDCICDLILINPQIGQVIILMQENTYVYFYIPSELQDARHFIESFLIMLQIIEY